MFHQVQGMAMGTKMAPAYANIFMATLEERLLAGYDVSPVLWKRYIDDVFCIWPGSLASFEEFMTYLNSRHPTIKFTSEASQASVNYLDLTIYKGDRFYTDHILDIRPYFKPTNKFQYLQPLSAHPRRTFRAVLKGEHVRLLRACSDETSYARVCRQMYTVFRDRGYPSSLIKGVQSEVLFSLRQLVLLESGAPVDAPEVFFVTRYTPDLNVPQLRDILRPLEHEDPHVPKACVSLKNAHNLRRKLVRAKLTNFEDPPISKQSVSITMTPILRGHSAGCGTPNCKCCFSMSRKIRIVSSTNLNSFAVPPHTNCDSSHVVYLLECKKCLKGNQYVGQTKRSMSQRLAGHRAARWKKPHLPVYKHFDTKPDHNFERDVRVTILEKCNPGNLLSREKHWIEALSTIHPKGLNSKFD